ncbi:hypothetical protein PAPYR_9619 [Paratrimastix pyriformis]|uniref:Uncharacterized protein n=1 Tax=Paratrimastix pyriformis TaxID=342808 RepID=A0ABQ8U816_9EUKA|nr:hypothetical protein PAPYR_9619 [Paratrimastix pyriformis]
MSGAIADSPVLCELHPVIFTPVRTFLHTPLRNPPISELFALLATLNVVAERERIQKKRLTDTSSLDPIIDGLITEITRICVRWDNTRDVGETLDLLNLSCLFPLAFHRLTRGREPLPLVNLPAETFVTESTFSNCMRLAETILDEVNKPTDVHKFVAHQTALLYQCLDGISTEYRQQIQKHFDALKAHWADGILDPEEIAWLREMTSALLQGLTHFAPTYRVHLQNKVDLLNGVPPALLAADAPAPPSSTAPPSTITPPPSPAKRM